MSLYSPVFHILFPLIALLFLILGLTARRPGFVTLALWISLIALFVHYQMSGAEIIGTYFDYWNAGIYSFNLLIVVASCLYLLLYKSMESTLMNVFNWLIVALLIFGSACLLINLWMNAHFVENRLAGTPVIEVSSNKLLSPCRYRVTYYKIATDGKVQYLCPAQYYIFPKVGTLIDIPDYLKEELPSRLFSKEPAGEPLKKN